MSKIDDYMDHHPRATREDAIRAMEAIRRDPGCQRESDTTSPEPAYTVTIAMRTSPVLVEAQLIDPDGSVVYTNSVAGFLVATGQDADMIRGMLSGHGVSLAAVGEWRIIRHHGHASLGATVERWATTLMRTIFEGSGLRAPTASRRTATDEESAAFNEKYASKLIRVEPGEAISAQSVFPGSAPARQLIYTERDIYVDDVTSGHPRIRFERKNQPPIAIT